MNRVLLSPIIFLFFSIVGFGQNYQWGKQFGNGETDRIIALDVDNDGNSYVLGESTSYHFDLNPGSGQEIIENNSSDTYGNICFIVKLDSDGNYIWGKVFNMKRTKDDQVIDLKIGSDNNIYALMQLNEYFGSSGSKNNIIIVKLDPQGNEIMTKSINNFNSPSGSAINASSFDLDSSNNIYLTGYFIDKIVLDPSNFILSANYWGNYILKIDTNGNYVWKTVYDYQFTEFEDIKIRPDGDINALFYIFDQTTTPYYTQKLIKLSSADGNQIWEKSFQDLIPRDFHISNNGNIIISNQRGDSSAPPNDIDPSANNIYSTAKSILIWLDSNGNLLDFKEYFQVETSFNVIQSDINNNYYFTSFLGWSEPMDADPSSATFFLNGCQSQFGESFVVKFNSNRKFENAFKLGTPDSDGCVYKFRFSGIKIKNDYEYYCGYFASYADLDPSSNVAGFDAVHNGVVNDDGFLLKLKNCNTSMPNADNNLTFCIQQNATINDILITGQNIKWYDGRPSGNLLPTSAILQDGITYYASQTPNSCESAKVPVTVHIQNTTAPTGNNQQTFCASQNPTLNDIITNGTDIKWYDSSNSTTPLPSTTLLVDGATYYTSQTVNGCESVNRLTVSVNLITGLNAQDYSGFICDEGNNGPENVDLSDFNSFLLSSSGNAFTYYASLNSAENKIPSEQLNTNYDLNSGLNTIYVRIDSNNGCYQIVRLLLTLVNEPTIAIPDTIIMCEYKKITVDAGSGFDTYLWSTNQNKHSVSITQPGNYSVTVTKNYGTASCATTKNFTVSSSNPATITSIETEDWTDNQNKIIVNTTGLGDYEFSLDGINYQDSNIFTSLVSGNYSVYVRDKNNCGTTTKSPIYLLIYPKFFTPNNDGFHDNWYVKFSQFEENFEVQIYDRYGKLIKSIPNTESWDGTSNGKVMPSDDYWFFVTRNDGQIYKGHFTLKR